MASRKIEDRFLLLLAVISASFILFPFYPVEISFSIDILLLLITIFRFFMGVNFKTHFLMASILFFLAALVLTASELLRTYPKITFFKFAEISNLALFLSICPIISLKEFRFTNRWLLVLIIALCFYYSIISSLKVGCLFCLENYNNIRLVPGLNNTSSTLLMCWTLVAITYNKLQIKPKRFDLILIAIAFGGTLSFPSRQLLISFFLLLMIFFFQAQFLHKFKFKFFFVVIGISFLFFSGILNILVLRFIKNINNFESYSRLLQLQYGWDLFLDNPFFGVNINPYIFLDLSGIHVFENSYIDLLVRDGLLGAVIIICLFLYSINKCNIKLLVFIMPAIFLANFNEIIYEGTFWMILFFIKYVHIARKSNNEVR